MQLKLLSITISKLNEVMIALVVKFGSLLTSDFD